MLLTIPLLPTVPGLPEGSKPSPPLFGILVAELFLELRTNVTPHSSHLRIYTHRPDLARGYRLRGRRSTHQLVPCRTPKDAQHLPNVVHVRDGP